MKKILFPILTLILAACSSSQVTVAPQVTVISSQPTATIIPMPTLHPRFVEFQDQIAAAGETFTLLPDGTIQQTTPDSAKIVPGLSVDRNGVMTLLVDGELITLNPADVTFDDENGVDIKGYEQDENGEWVPAEVSVESDLNWEYINDPSGEHRLPLPEVINLNGVDMRVGFGVDDSIEQSVPKIQLHENWTSDAGNDAESAPGLYMQQVYYKVWMSNQEKNKTGLEKTTFDEWVGWVGEMQKSKVWDPRLTTTIMTNVMDGGEYDLQPVQVAPMVVEGVQLPEGVRPITDVELIVVRGKAVENMDVFDDGLGVGKGSNYDLNGRLIIYISPNTNNRDSFSSKSIIGSMSGLPRYLSTGSKKIMSTEYDVVELMDIFGKQISSDRFSSFFQIIPGSAVEQKFNR